MKVKLFIILFAAMLGWTACTNEEFIDNSSVQEGLDVSFNATLSIEDITTKAGMEYEEPDKNVEKTVTKCIVAIFKNENGTPTTCVGYKIVDNPGSNNGVYDLGSIRAKSGNVRIVVVANPAATDYPATEADLSSIGYSSFNKVETTSKFSSASLVKVGELNTTLDATKPNETINVDLKQLPARVDVKFGFSDGGSDETWTYEVSSFEVEGINPKSNILLGDYNSNYQYNPQNTGYSSISWSGNESETAKTLSEFSFYTYERATAANPVLITMTGILKGIKNGQTFFQETKNYKYSLDPKFVQNVCKTNGLVHGNLYELTGNISLTSKSIEFTAKSKDWEYKNVNADIGNVNYLFVSEKLIYMPNTLSYTFSYASNLDVGCSIESVKFTGYKTNGDTAPGTYKSGDDQYPTVTLDKNAKTITVSMKAVPKNYVPTHIMLKVKTSGGKVELSQDVEVIHYPTPYVEAYQNNKNGSYGGVPSGMPGGRTEYDYSQNNYNVFVVTSIASGNFTIGDPTTTATLSNGSYGPYPDVMITGTTADLNNLVSPKFIIASQHGITSQISYTNAQIRCHLYKEYYEGKLLENWRVPTEAELKYISYLQRDGNSAVKSLLEGAYYWCALQNYEVRMSTGNSSYNGSSQYVRCVHDVY
ncbi:hypothetical protein [Parabacteroides sp. AF17-28]|uniref:fimbrial tip adhesin FimD n=1 Tax=Parabacteroides sp. AF17-28 TaxID=2292241 RepID=UPI000FF149C6|nr:hypothetical protein [Parabacteroides sp. AF17-28]RHR53955.1 hypothetical protein DWW90_15830 [Parabacteroides sp. AF17-28]